MIIIVKIYINHKIVNFNKKYHIIYGNKSNSYILNKLCRLKKILDEISDKFYQKSNSTFL